VTRKTDPTTGLPSYILASCSNDQTIRLWDLDSYNCISVLEGHSHVVESVSFPSISDEIVNNIFLTSTSRDKTLKIWYLPTSRCIATLEGHENWVQAVKYDTSGQFLISISDLSIKIWDIQQIQLQQQQPQQLQIECVKTIQSAHSTFISCLDLNNSLLVATADVQNNLFIWNFST